MEFTRKDPSAMQIDDAESGEGSEDEGQAEQTNGPEEDWYAASVFA